MDTLHGFQFSTIQTSVTFLFLFYFDDVFDRLHVFYKGMACISDSFTFIVDIHHYVMSQQFNIRKKLVLK